MKLINNNVGLLIHADHIDSSAYDQINQIVNHPSIQGLVAIMPDVHAGAGCVIGFTGKFKHSVIPNIVGVDLGCGVITHKLPSCDLDLPDIYDFINRAIPSGFKSHATRMHWSTKQKRVINDCETLVLDLKLRANPALQAGTLGGGNHFIEIERSPTTGDTYLTVHSGSRKFGLEVAKYYQAKAVTLCKQMGISVPRELEYLPMDAGGTEYIHAMQLAQEYARVNRELILAPILKYIDVKFDSNCIIESVHNYISPHDNIIRKGAISAHKDELIIIPLNMSKTGGILLGMGLGNKDYNYSAPHGAGRVFGRNVMKRKLKAGELTMAAFEESMEGVYTKSVCTGTIDESAAAYKSFSMIEKHLNETVNVVDHAVPILAFKDVK